MEIHVRKSKLFDVELIDGQFDTALDYYFDWCEENNKTPEINISAEMMDLSDSDFENVLFYAVKQGLKLV